MAMDTTPLPASPAKSLMAQRCSIHIGLYMRLNFKLDFIQATCFCAQIVCWCTACPRILLAQPDRKRKKRKKTDKYNHPSYYKYIIEIKISNIIVECIVRVVWPFEFFACSLCLTVRATFFSSRMPRSSETFGSTDSQWEELSFCKSWKAYMCMFVACEHLLKPNCLCSHAWSPQTPSTQPLHGPASVDPAFSTQCLGCSPSVRAFPSTSVVGHLPTPRDQTIHTRDAAHWHNCTR